MKKQLFLLPLLLVSLTALTNCSTSVDDTILTPQTNPSNTTQYFHPPAWIKGTWASTSSDPIKYKFTDNDFISILTNTETSNTAQLKQIVSMGGTASVEEIVNNNQYYFTMKMNNSNAKYEFKKITDTKLLWVNHPSGSIIDIYLYKQ